MEIVGLLDQPLKMLIDKNNFIEINVEEFVVVYI